MRAGRVVGVIVLILVLTAVTAYTVLTGGPGGNNGASQPNVVTEPGNEERAVHITLNGDTAVVDGRGAYAEGSAVTITKAGTYIISGRLDEGQIAVETDDDDAVRLVLEGVSVRNSSEPALDVRNSHGLLIYLKKETVNTLVSGTETEITAWSSDSSASGGAVMLSDDAVISGDGRLDVFGYINNGIHCSNDLLITSGELNVTAVNNGIKGKDSLTVSGGSISILSGGDGLKSDDETDAGTGILRINGGNISIKSFDDGIQAVSQIFLSGGTVDMECADDGANCAGNIMADGSVLEIKCSDDGIHADGDVIIDSGNITVISSTEGIEGKNIAVNGGTVSITASDDGFNCTDAKGTAAGWRPGTDSGRTDLPTLTINDGNVYVNAQGDGLDSNGDLIINGGRVIIDGPSGRGNGSLDSGTESGGHIYVNGGTVLSVGSNGMVEIPEDGSGQKAFSYNAAFSAGTTIRILDSSGNVLIEHKTAKSGGNMIFSSPDLVMNGEYILQMGDSSFDIVITENVTVYGQNGGLAGGPGQFGGDPGNFGGGPGAGQGQFGGGPGNFGGGPGDRPDRPENEPGGQPGGPGGP